MSTHQVSIEEDEGDQGLPGSMDNPPSSNSVDSFDQLLHVGDPEDQLFAYKARSRLREWIDSKYEIFVKPQEGIYLLVFSQFCNSVMIATCKLLETDKGFETPIHPLQILFARMSITYLGCISYIYLTGCVPNPPFGPKNLRKLLFMRGAMGFFGVFGLYYSLQYLSLSDAVAITFLVPMVTAFLAWIFLREIYSLFEAGCALIALCGVLLIAKPDFIFGSKSISKTSNDNIESSSTEKRLLASAFGLVGVLGASSVYILLRKIGFQAHPLLSVSYFALTCVIISLGSLCVIPSLTFATPTTLRGWVLFTLMGVFGFIMQFSLTAGVQRVSAGRASLITYTNMIFALCWDVLLWHHFPGFLSILGTFLIIGGAFAIVRRKKQIEPKVSDLENDISTVDPNSNDIVLEDFQVHQAKQNLSSNVPPVEEDKHLPTAVIENRSEN